jgi:hypothetical protein
VHARAIDRDQVSGVGKRSLLAPPRAPDRTRSANTRCAAVTSAGAFPTACRLDARRRQTFLHEAHTIGLATEHDIAPLPNVELHVHFGGNFSEAVALDLARRHGLDPAVAVPLHQGSYPTGYRDFPDFLRALIALDRLVRTPDDVETVAAAFARGQAAPEARVDSWVEQNEAREAR